MVSSKFSTPILFLIFNRPDTTKIVFEKIKLIKPKYLFISADGPKSNKDNEKELCEKSRQIINDINWECQIKTNFSEINLGCRKAVSSGITWFFNSVEEGIILEDDCVPDISFFNFCASLLEKYSEDTRIMHIGGTNFQDGIIRGDGSYYFSKNAHVWGWATWKRAWNKYNVNVPTFPEFLKQNIIANVYPNKKMQNFFLRDFELVFNNQKDTWDYQWVYALAVNNGLSIIPNKNLVTNIGFDKNATHTILASHPLAHMPKKEIKEFVHPSFIIPDYEADLYTFKRYMSINKLRKLLHLFRNKV